MSTVEKIRLRFNYRSGQNLIDASEAVLGEHRSYKANDAGRKGIINFYKCAEGLAQQAERICTSIIPGSLARGTKRALGDIAVLYLDWRDGDVIEATVQKTGMKFIRIDRGAPYAKTPLTRWLEDCAAWCAGGWKRNSPRLSGLLHMWQGFNPSIRTESALYELRLRLVRFLFAHRSAELLAGTWLSEMNSRLLGETFKREPTLRDEMVAFSGLQRDRKSVV